MLVLILVMLVAPGGIVGVYRRTLARVDARPGDAAPRTSRSQRLAPPEPTDDHDTIRHTPTSTTQEV